MEPHAAVRELWEGLRNRDYRSAFARLETLIDWVSAGGSLPELQLDTTYQGYKNHATWAVALWLNNDHGLYSSCRRLLREACSEAEDHSRVIDGTWTVAEATRFLLADRLKAYLDELNPIKNNPSAFADLLSAALEDVDYGELVESFLE